MTSQQKHNKVSPISKPTGIDPCLVLSERENRFAIWKSTILSSNLEIYNLNLQFGNLQSYLAIWKSTI